MGAEGEAAQSVEGAVHRHHRGVHPVLQEGAGTAQPDGGLHVPGEYQGHVLQIREGLRLQFANFASLRFGDKSIPALCSVIRTLPNCEANKSRNVFAKT